MATNKDAIQRNYLKEYIDRKRRRPETAKKTGLEVLNEVDAWIDKQFARAKKPGGIGK